MIAIAKPLTPAATGPFATLHNGEAFRFDDVPLLSAASFHAGCIQRITNGARIAALFALPAQPAPELVVVLADDSRGELAVARGETEDGGFPSLTPRAPQAQGFEREIFELHGLRPEGHPWLKPLRRHPELEYGLERGPAHPFFQVEGPGVHEVAVGPVHAGIIEPGHFRFQCQGEEVLSLEIHLGYQRRGAEALLLRSSPARRLAIAESLAGDTSVGHALAWCRANEALAGVRVPEQAHGLRAIGLELERCANHVGDLGALCGDVGYLPGASFFGRLRGEFLNLTLELCGNRFGRGLVRPGGVRFDLEPRRIRKFLDRIELAEREVNETAEMTFGEPSVLSRFEGTGAVTRRLADELGLVGPAARACGCERDTRKDHAAGAYKHARIEVATAVTGDVMARAQVRWREVKSSVDQVKLRVADLLGGALVEPMPAPRPGMLGVALTEGWRGEIVHVLVTGDDGQLRASKVIDPSFHNWLGLAMALRGDRISDFPLCNKSFNLSYAGHDL